MKTQTVWNFTPDEFAWVWAETGLDEYPDPIRIIETPTTTDEYARLTAEISTRYPRHADPDLTGPLRALANPDVRIVCKGRSHNSHKRVRALGVAVADLGVILFQKSGTTADFGSDIKLVVTQRHNLGKHIAATMPPAPAGTVETTIGYTPRVRGDEPPMSWTPSRSGEYPPEERIRALLRLPRNAEGHLRIERSLHARHHYPPTYSSWIDIRDGLPAAGRYLITVDNNECVVIPASAATIAHELTRRAQLVHS
ncbi:MULTISPECIES: ESX secretion-associated protein EspG [unclassified Nocardia]|uniref:ESX secretion-associated protein EspG n=1 Tax=unclassified Nocardia TaxID=2637762 RepID=UPI001CE3D5F3|nr:MULTISPECIES: ESX secretion-associated protein EspG [unclassified Nocardia]